MTTYTVSVNNNQYALNTVTQDINLSLSRTGGQGTQGNSISNAYLDSNNDFIIEISNAAGTVVQTVNVGGGTIAGQLNAFDTIYLGSKTAAPALDNSGDALLDGALFFNTTTNELGVYDLGTTTWEYPSLEAATSASNAATSETNANNSETAAATSETNAATSETNAATSETNAATSATNAGNSETAAASSAAAASTSADEAAASVASIDLNSIDINGGTIDGTVIGGTTPDAGSFTTGQFGTSLNVDGNITSDGLTVDGIIETTGGTDINMDGAGSGQLKLEGNGYKSAIALNADGMNVYTNSAARGVILGTNETQRMLVGGNGDISFYEDTGTTPKFYWDASAERLGIGTVSPATALDVTGTITANQFVGGNISAPKNLIINGGFDVWQRGTSQTVASYASDDRWYNIHAGSTKTHSQQVFTLGQTDVAGNPKYYSRTAITSVAGAANYTLKEQRIEDVTKTSGKTVTVTFWAKADASKDIVVELSQDFGTGGSPSSVVLVTPQTVTLTTSWVKHSLTFAVPSVSGKTLGTDGNHRLSLIFWFEAGSVFNSRTNTLGQQSGTFDMARVSLCEGDVTALDDPFEERTYGEELALCQRYLTQMLLRHRFPATAVSQVGGSNISFPAEMRATPSLTVLSNSYTANVVAVFLSQVTTSGAIFELQANAAGDTYRGDNYSFDAEL